MAEAVFRSLTGSNPRLSHIDSAGTGAYHAGDPPDPRTMSTLENNGIVGYDHAARKIHASDFSKYDYILAMDKDNMHDLQWAKQIAVKKGARTGEEKAKILLFGDFGGNKGEKVIDPYYGARNGFEIAYEQMVRFSKGFMSEVLQPSEADVS